MDEAAVVTCFLRNRGEVLLFERAADAETYPGRWGTVTGYVEGDDPRGTAAMEIREETGLDVEMGGATGDGEGDGRAYTDDGTLVRAGDPFAVVDDALGREWTVHPFLFDVGTRAVRTNEETARAAWASPTAILRRETVPDLWRSYADVAPTPETVAVDDEHGSAYLSVRALEALRDAAGLAAVGRERDAASEADGGGAVAGGTGTTGDAVEGMDSVVDTAEALLGARPSMAALANRVNRAMAGAGTPAAVETAAIEGIERALAADDGAAENAAALLDGGTVLTLSRSGTVLDALRRGADAAIVAESRPAREGVGVAESLAGAGLDVTLCTDAAVGHLLATRVVDAVVVGADAVLPDGRVVNKTGTRLAALAADREGVPCYAVAAADKVRGDDDLHLESGPAAAVYDGEAPIDVANPTFDVTPADLVDGVVTDRGTLESEGVVAVAEEHRELARWRETDSE